MIYSVIFFCSSVLLLAIAVVWMLRPVIKGVGEFAKTHAQIYAIAYFKCCIGVIIAAGITFKATWQPITLAETVNWALWDWMIHIGEPFLAGLLYIQGFLDRSVQRADEVKAKVVANVAPDGTSTST